MTGLLQDVRGAFRLFGKSPAHFGLMIATLALGTGVNVAAFSVADATLFRPLPVAEPDKLLRIVSSNPLGFFSHPDYLELAAHKGMLASVAATTAPRALVEHSEAGEQLFSCLVTGNYFAALGVPPALGRGFLPEEDRLPVATPVAVISHELWGRRFRQAPDVLGKTLRLDGAIFTIVGVAPRGFTGITRAARVDLWLPIATQHLVWRGLPGGGIGNPYLHWLAFVGRLAPGVTPQQAQPTLEAAVRRINRAHGRLNDDTRLQIYSDWEAQSKLSPRSTLLQVGLVALVGLILLLSCLNAANLILARAITRRKEIALRLSLGATRRRVLRQLLTEGFVIAALGTGLGLVLASAILDLVATLHPADMPSLSIDARLDRRVLVIAGVAALFATGVFGLVPALDAREWELGAMIKTRGAAPDRRGRWAGRGLLAMAQVALCTLLIVHTGLLVRSLRNAWRVDPGFRTESVLMASVALAPLALAPEAQRETWTRLLERTRALPGVVKAAWVNDFPFSMHGWIHPMVGGREYRQAVSRILVGPDYFATMGIPIVRGREFRAEDRAPTADVIIVDEATAEHFWPGQDPLGKEFKTSFNAARTMRVIGVAKNVHYSAGTSDQRWRMRVYRNIEQDPRETQALYVHTSGPADGLRAALDRAIRQAEPRAFVRMATMAEIFGQELLLMEVGRAVLGAMALLGLALAAIGLYGLLSFDIGRRTHELGIRLAVGAEPQSLGRLVLRESLPVVGCGLGIGLAAAALTTSLAADMLVEVAPRDPLVFLSAALVVTVTSLAAISLPARRAVRSNPLVALRAEP